jgi:uncharacterized protein with HEPN domain
VRSDASRVDDIAKAIDAIDRYAQRGRDEFFRDELIQTWMLHHLEIIGEALRSMTEQFQARFRDYLGWSGWVGLRTILTHHYFRVDPELVWSTIERDIPKLKGSITKIRTELSSSNS